MEIVELKKEYNKLITRFNNGDKYCKEHLNDKNIDRYVKELCNIAQKLGAYIEEFRRLGYEMSKDEVLNGFKEEE